LYPAYASYKALSATPVSNPEATRDVERWLMYWSVVGTWTGLEGLAGFLFTWYVFSDALIEY
jgi:receptor expression-enhancing protein 1/2/3/4